MKLTKQKESEAIKLYHQYFDSYINGDLETYASTLDEEVEMIGTTESEVAHNKTEIIELFKGHIDQMVGKADMRNRQISAKPVRDMVLINETCDIYVLGEPEWTFYSKLRLSTLLHETESGWKVIQQHGSLPDLRVQEGETIAIDKISRENIELRDAVKRRTAELENKNRELEIEAAVERVRAQSMTIQHSDDLHKVTEELLHQLNKLSIDGLTGTTIYLVDANDIVEAWDLSSPGNIGTPGSYTITYDAKKNPVSGGWVKEWRTTDKNLFELEFPKEDLLKVVEELKEIHPEIAVMFENAIISGQLTHQWSLGGRLSKGMLVVDIIKPPTEDIKNIVSKMAGAFNLAYQRFEDLQKAEAQAREAQIEASLERVRAKAMSMQNSDELDEVLSVLCEQFDVLGILPISTHMTVFNFDNNTFTFRETGKYGDRSFGEQTVDLDAMDTWKDTVDKWKADKATDVNKLHFPTDTLAQVWEVFHESFASMPEESRITPADYPDGIYHTAGKHPFGYIGMNQTRPASPEEEQIVIKFANEFGRAYQRFLDLQKAEAQAREAQIEAALEKVRSRSLAMHISDELTDVVAILFEKMKDLQVPFTAVGIATSIEGSKDLNGFVCGQNDDGLVITNYRVPYFDNPIPKDLYNALEKQLDYFVGHYSKEEKDAFYEYVIEHTAEFRHIPEDIKRMIFDSPTYSISMVAVKNAVFNVNDFDGKVLADDEIEIIKRFARVFDQAYTRFLDLQKAETQAKEAKIEVALEKVRSRTMGMQKSDELADVANVLFEEMNELVHNLWTCGFVLCEKDRAEDEWWLSLEDGFTRGFFLPNVNDYAHAHLYEGWLKKDDFRTVQLEGDKLQEHYDWLMEIPIAKSIFDDMEAAGMQRPEWQKLHAAYFSKGYLVIITREPSAEEAIFKRFAQVFDLTYTRFLDLQKAETQAREAQIEGALEKVRSRSLAMQSPSELIEVAQLLREEMGALGVEELETSSIYIHDENSDLTQCWFTIKDTDDPDKSVTDQMTIDLQETWVGRQMDVFYRSDQNKASILMKGDQRIEWIRYCEGKSDLFGNSEFYGETIPERTYHLYKFSNGFLGAASPGNISDESWDLMRRATGVFSFAYTRFQDLQKAEASALAAMRQASLDRIRADISSMRNAEDLNRITPLVFNELTTLGIPFIRCGVFIVHEKEKNVEIYLSTPEGESLAVMTLPFSANDMTSRSVEAWKKEEVYIQHWNQADFINWGNSMQEKGYVKNLKTYLGSATAPEILHLHFVPFGQGLLYVGSTENLSEEEIDLVKAMAKAFSIAYSRYEDFVKLEQAKAEVESAMSELKATQSQLVQQEKLASLGQLTAGIAHEIKNPLNFVNNFSDVSLEMIDEALEELGKTSQDDHTAETAAILADIKANLAKIHQHGSRADSIVKSMLQHSRGGDGKMDPTDLNSLVKEYVNLAFHGMRASKEPINVDIDLQLDESVGEVPLIAEDFSRVVLNLCNNAFDAMRSKLSGDGRPETGGEEKEDGGRMTGEIYNPKLTVRTKSENGQILIEIEDNGPGIPDEIKDKILQPFFTTKKGTQGTGLGLSITNDIIKAHGGSLKISSNNHGAKFIVVLPKSSI